MKFSDYSSLAELMEATVTSLNQALVDFSSSAKEADEQLNALGNLFTAAIAQGLNDWTENMKRRHPDDIPMGDWRMSGADIKAREELRRQYRIYTMADSFSDAMLTPSAIAAQPIGEQMTRWSSSTTTWYAYINTDTELRGGNFQLVNIDGQTVWPTGREAFEALWTAAEFLYNNKAEESIRPSGQHAGAGGYTMLSFRQPCHLNAGHILPYQNEKERPEYCLFTTPPEKRKPLSRADRDIQALE